VERISVGELKKNFNDVLKLAGNAKHRFVIQDRGKENVGIVPLEDLALLENLDGAKPVAVARLALPEMKRHLSEDLARVATGEQRIIVHDKEEDLAAVVPERDVALLQNLDARIDIEAARRLLQEKLNEDD
jgi:PHD/YefM family antitoxin component YafN of YafNO toxin-antitoxin module